MVPSSLDYVFIEARTFGNNCTNLPLPILNIECITEITQRSISDGSKYSECMLTGNDFYNNEGK